jgi:hypothetical protein
MQDVSAFAGEVSCLLLLGPVSRLCAPTTTHRPLCWPFQAQTFSPYLLWQRGWQINPSTQTVHFANKLAGAGARDAIPKKETIVSNLQFAKELESIV